MKKILFVVDERMTGGTSIVLENIVKSFANVHFDILVLHDRGDRLSGYNNVSLIFGSPFFEVCDLRFKDILAKKDIKLILKKIYLIFLLKTNLIKFKIRKERKKILSQKYDIEVSFKDGIGTYFVAYGDSATKIRWIHADYMTNNPGKNYMKTFSKAIENYDKIVAISENIGKNFNKLFHKEKITEVIYNVIYYKPPKEITKKNEKKANNEFSIVCVGRLSYIKGYERVIETIYKLKNDGLFENASLKIVGDGENYEHLVNMIIKYNLGKQVHILKHKTEPWKYVSNADLFILSSYSEAYPTTVIESLINQIPVFALEYVSCYEMLNKENSIIVKNTNTDLYEGLKYVLNNREQILEMKKKLTLYKYNNNSSICQIKKLLDIEE